jgi:hypothetical protein
MLRCAHMTGLYLWLPSNEICHIYYTLLRAELQYLLGKCAAERGLPLATTRSVMMVINFFIGVAGKPAEADESAMCAINRHLQPFL